MSDVIAIKQLVTKSNELREEIKKIIVGQDEVVEQVLISIFSGGACAINRSSRISKDLISTYRRECSRN